MMKKALFVVQVYKRKRWNRTIWTGFMREEGAVKYSGKPVSKLAAIKAVARAQKKFPGTLFRIAEAKP